MARGGARVGAGRKKGSRSKKTITRALVAKVSGVTPLEVMLATMGIFWRKAQTGPDGKLRKDGLIDTADARLACEVAKDAAPYCHGKIVTPVELRTPPGSPLEMNMNVRGAVQIYLPDNGRRRAAPAKP